MNKHLVFCILPILLSSCSSPSPGPAAPLANPARLGQLLAHKFSKSFLATSRYFLNNG